MKRVILRVLLTFGAFLILTENVFASDVKISKEIVKQGGFFEIFIEDVNPREVFTVIFQKRKYQSSPGVSVRSHRVVIPAHVFDETGEAEILLRSVYQNFVPQKITIEKADFKESENVEVLKPLSLKNLKKYKEEQTVLKEIYSRTTKYPFFVTIDEPFFEYPLERKAEVSSSFGFVRKRKVGEKSEKIERVPHGGVDLIVPKGKSVFASETGIVRLARELINSGNTIIIDHGYNIFSIYMHLSYVSVSEGDVVWRSDEIGVSGNTGRVTGAHLHFGIRVWDTWIDPKYFVKALGGEK